VSESDQSQRSARALFFLSVVLVVAGSCGSLQSATDAFSRDPPASPTPQVSATANATEAGEAAARALVGARATAPLRRTLAATNVVVSSLLLVGGVLLFTRRPSAPWWITQAAIANVLWTIANAVSESLGIVGALPELHALFDQQARAERAADPSGGFFQPGAAHYIGLAFVLLFAGAVLRIIVYGWLAWRARRADIGTLIAAAARERDS
jgi:hypothetical protein